MALPSLMCKDKVSMLCGGRHKLCRMILENLLEKLSSVADLEFFEDGPATNEKFAEWVQRRNENYEAFMEIIDSISIGRPLQEIIDDSRNLKRVFTNLSLIERVSRKYGKFTCAVTKECDAEIARYANNNSSVLAVLADDMDFLIFPGRWRYFSVRAINFETLTTMEYSRPVLRNFLNLNDKQLIILSTLAGNDVIQHHDIRKFHKNLLPQTPKDKFLWIANHIKKNLMLPYDHLVRAISRLLWNNKQIELNWKATNLVKDSLNFYNIVRQGFQALMDLIDLNFHRNST